MIPSKARPTEDPRLQPVRKLVRKNPPQLKMKTEDEDTADESMGLAEPSERVISSHVQYPSCAWRNRGSPAKRPRTETAYMQASPGEDHLFLLMGPEH